MSEKFLIGVNCSQDEVKDYEVMSKNWLVNNKPSKIAATFNKIDDLQEVHLKHFKNAPYLWKPIAGGPLWGGMLMDDKLDYVHIVLASKEVVEFLSSKDKVDELMGKLQSISLN